MELPQLPTPDQCVLAGVFVKLHGINGLLLKYDANFDTSLDETELLFVEIQGNRVPFFILPKTLQQRNNDAVMRLQFADNHPQAQPLIGCKVYVAYSPEDTDHDDETLFDDDLADYKVFDAQKGYIGNAAQIIDIPGNPLLQIFFNDIEILVPANEDIVTDINHELCQIHIDAPDGLLDMYLNEEE